MAIPRRQRRANNHHNNNIKMTTTTPTTASYTLLLLLSLALLSLHAHVVMANNPDGSTPWSLRNNNLQSHIQKWVHDPDATAREFGHIKHWDLRNVTSLRNLFAFNEDFNEDISRWNVSAVTDFSSLFWEASSFEQNLGAWDVAAAEDMKCMFCGAASYTGEGLEAWNNKLHHVKDMFNMFEGSGVSSSAVDLSGWNVSSVTTLREMFRDTPHFKQTLCWEIHPAAVATDMFNDSDACFDPNCVAPHIAEMAGCSGATTSMKVWIGITLMGLVSLVSLF